MVLPGKGLGIDTVEAESPAALAGLESGMIVTKCNGRSIVDDVTFADAIAASGGVLELELLAKADGQPLVATVQMTRIAVASF